MKTTTTTNRKAATISERVEQISGDRALCERLVQLSKGSGAWAYSVLPFSNEVTFVRFQSPSCVPDYYRDLMRPQCLMGYRGKLVPFTAAAIVREQNRGVGAE